MTIDAPATPDIPAGFERRTRRSPLTDPWEPLYTKTTDKAVIVGLRLAKPHTNGRGLIHGGLIAALSDNAMGHSCAYVMGGVSSLVTISLAVDFIGNAEIGQWLAIESHCPTFAVPTKSTARLIVTNDLPVSQPVACAQL